MFPLMFIPPLLAQAMPTLASAEALLARRPSFTLLLLSAILFSLASLLGRLTRRPSPPDHTRPPARVDTALVDQEEHSL